MTNNSNSVVSKLPLSIICILILCVTGLFVGCSKQNQSGAAKLPEATLAEINVALDSWMMMKGSTPRSITELTNFPALRNKRLPAAPEGKKLTIDPVTRQVVFANE